MRVRGEAVFSLEIEHSVRGDNVVADGGTRSGEHDDSGGKRFRTRDRYCSDNLVSKCCRDDDDPWCVRCRRSTWRISSARRQRTNPLEGSP